MRSKKPTRIVLFLLSTSFVPLNGADIDTTHSASDKEDSMPSLIEEDDSQVVSPPLESQHEPEINRQKLYKALDRSYMKPLTQKVRRNFGIVLGNDCLAQIAHNLQPLIDFFIIYEYSPSKVQHSHDKCGKPLKPLYDFKERLQKIKKCKDNSDRLYTFSLILLGLPSHLVKNGNLIFLTEEMEKYCGMGPYDRAKLQRNFYRDVENMYPKGPYYLSHIDDIIDGLKCKWEVKLEKRYKADDSDLRGVAVSPDDGYLLWFENRNDVYLWDITKEQAVLCQGNKGEKEGIIQLIWSSDGKFFFSSSYADGAISVWNKERRRLIQKVKVTEKLFNIMSPSEHGLFVADRDGHLYVVKKSEKAYKVERLVTCSDDTMPIISNVVSLPNSCILFNRGKNIWIYDEYKKKLIYTLDTGNVIKKIKASPNGKYVAFSAYESLRICLWDKEKNTLDKKLTEYSAPSCSSIRFSHDSRFLFFTERRTSVVVIDILREQKIELVNCKELVSVTSFNHCNRFVTVNRHRVNSTNFNTMIQIWKLPLLKRMESPGLVEFIVKRKWRLTIALCAQEIFALITNYAFELDLPFTWVWEKNSTQNDFFSFFT
ncbi:MAG: WD40 repeat domain-containing protein [Bacteroidota bacterium]